MSSGTVTVFARMETSIESMEEAMTLFIQFIEEHHANDAGAFPESLMCGGLDSHPVIQAFRALAFVIRGQS